MRWLLAALGFIGILGYSVFGALVMNQWAVEAASGLPLDAAIAEMQSAGQPYSAIPGIVFAGFGVILGIVWAVLAIRSQSRRQRWLAGATWGAIVAMGAPAFFEASFRNMNNVGDTFLEWDAKAAFALELPLYVASGFGALVAVVCFAIALRSRSADSGQVKAG